MRSKTFRWSRVSKAFYDDGKDVPSVSRVLANDTTRMARHSVFILGTGRRGRMARYSDGGCALQRSDRKKRKAARAARRVNRSNRQ